MILVWLATTILVVVVVSLHYEVLNFISRLLPRLPVPRRRRVTVAVLGVLLAHIVEIHLFAVGMFLVEANSQKPLVTGTALPAGERIDFVDSVYLSFTTYTSLGYGDLLPLGELRVIAAVEVLTGLLAIAWSASFIFLEMNELWREN